MSPARLKTLIASLVTLASAGAGLYFGVPVPDGTSDAVVNGLLSAVAGVSTVVSVVAALKRPPAPPA